MSDAVAPAPSGNIDELAKVYCMQRPVTQVRIRKKHALKIEASGSRKFKKDVRRQSEPLGS